jgi:dihydrolipoamide dehydrogenase
VSDAGTTQTIRFDNAIIAAGSRPSSLPGIDMDSPRVMDSTDALELEEIPKKLLIIGGGIIGLEMATVYHAFGSEITVVEYMDQLIPGCDSDLVRPLHLRLKRQYKNIYLKTKVTAVKSTAKTVKVSFEGEGAPASDSFDRVLVAVGRRPNGDLLAADKAGVNVDERGFIAVDKQQHTNVAHIYAIGDITGNPMLAHKATHEGKIAAEVIAGQPAAFDAKTIPSVAYTDPEIAWMGLTETQAKADNIDYESGVFPWAASGRAIGIGRKEGLTKLLFDKDTGRILGAGIVGPNAGELIAETVLALEMGADAEDIGLSIHPHPTLSETIAFASEMATGTITDLYHPKK